VPTLEERLVGFTDPDRCHLPLPGAGNTPARHHALLNWGAMDLSFARIAEAHTDAVAILAECGRSPRRGALYGVWASDAPPSRVTCERAGRDEWILNGIKQFCSGADFVDAALVTARHEDGVYLFDLSVKEAQVCVRPSAWASPAFADTATTAVEFNALVVSDRCRLGESGWYLDRSGFWHGSVGPAACWAGGAKSLIDAAAALNRRDAYSLAHVGALQASGWGLNAILEQAGREMDPHDTSNTARTRGLKVRHLIERTCSEVLDRFARATGPHLLAYDPKVIRQHQALTLYIRQCHGERDLAGIPAPLQAAPKP
jgi:hypothetical protein